MTTKALTCAMLLLLTSAFNAFASRLLTVSLYQEQEGTNQFLFFHDRQFTTNEAEVVLSKIIALDTNQLIIVSVHDGVSAYHFLSVLRFLENIGFRNIGVGFYKENGVNSIGVVVEMKTEGMKFGAEPPKQKSPIKDLKPVGPYKDSRSKDSHGGLKQPG